jgi:pimeloyl-ACP methyl ester carboxylesterase
VNPTIVSHREVPSNKSAIVFIHGFGGSPEKTWQQFPSLLADDGRLEGWNIHSLGYPTGIALDLVGIWKADPNLATLADGLRTKAQLPPLKGYDNLVLIAHSMGGLVVQRAIVDDDGSLTKRVSHVVLFGTPSGGLAKAKFLRFWKRQIKDMGLSSDFVADLRKRWTEKFAAWSPFRFWAVAGESDEFVPRSSSIDIFPQGCRSVVPGDHLSIVHADTSEHLSVILVAECLTAENPQLLRSDAISVTGEWHRAQQTVADLEGKRGLDERRLVDLALALEVVGRREEAIKILREELEATFLDATGTLAGRLKRRWIDAGLLADGQTAEQLYEYGFAAAKGANNHYQARYHGINVAFMKLALNEDAAGASKVAEEVLGYCDHGTESDKWALATEAEARLILGQVDESLNLYRRARQSPPHKRRDLLRQNLSMYQQATRVAGLINNVEAAEKLQDIFLAKNN